MAHELDKVLQFFKSFGDDNFRHPGNGSVHKMCEYASIVKKFLDKEVGLGKDLGEFTASVVLAEVGAVKEVSKDTIKNLIEAKKEVQDVSKPQTPSPAKVEEKK